MGIFEYLAVLISVILGLGVTHLAVGASKIVQNRDQCKPNLTHSLWALATLLYILIVWWGMYWWSNHTAWSAYQYLFITGYALTLFFVSALLFPYDMDKDIDFEVYFFKQRRWFFSTYIVAWLLDIPETLSKGDAALREVPPLYVVFICAHIGIAVVGLTTDNRRIHVALPIIWIVGTLAYIGTSTMRVIAS